MSKDVERRPSLFRNWKFLYIFVIVNTLAVYILLVLFSAYAR